MPNVKAKPPLSELENKVMSVIWDAREATAERVRNEVVTSQPLKDSTIRTILRRLEAKGYVQHRSEGRTYIYSPVVGAQNVAADAVRSIIDRFCGGSIEALLVGMVNREVVSREKLQELADRIAATVSTTSIAPADAANQATAKKSTRRRSSVSSKSSKR